jgi:hypothetical protein
MRIVYYVICTKVLLEYYVERWTMSNWEDNLPPILKAKLEKAGSFTPDERVRLKAKEQIDGILSKFYKGDLDADALWKELRPLKEQGKAAFLREAELAMLDGLSMTSSPAELAKRKKGIIALDSVRGEGNTSALEQSLGSIDLLQAKQKKEQQQAYDQLRTEIERNPQLRVRQIKQGGQTVSAQLSVDEAIKTLPEWQDFLVNHEQQYSEELARIIERVRKLMR